MVPGFNTSNLLIVANNEFKRIISHPIVIVVTAILIFVAVLNGFGSTNLAGIEQLGLFNDDDVFIKVGMSQLFWISSLYCTIIAMFLGLFTIAGDRAKKSIGVLIVKPLYRKDIVIGKLLGVLLFLALLIFLNFSISSLIMMLLFRPPFMLYEFFLRLFTLMLILFFECSLMASITMMIGISFKNLLEAAGISISFLYLEWFAPISGYPGYLDIFSPSRLYFKIFNYSPIPSFNGLLDTSLGFFTWLHGTVPYILLIVLYIMALTQVNCYLFSRSDSTDGSL